MVVLLWKRWFFPFGGVACLFPLGRRENEQPAKLSVPSALPPRLATLATAVGFKVFLKQSRTGESSRRFKKAIAPSQTKKHRVSCCNIKNCY